MILYLVRHGETYSNVEKRYCGSYDSELTSKGIEQAKAVREKLSDVSFKNAFSSSRKRAISTAEIILKEKNIELIKDVRLDETSFGIFENKTYDEIKEVYTEECAEWESDWKGYVIPQGESVDMSFIRVKEFIRKLEQEEYQEDNILVVTHGGILRLFYCYILNEDIELFWKFSAKNTGVSVLRYEYGNWYIDSIGL